MPRMSDVRRGLCARLATIPDFHAYAFIPDAIIVPCAFVQPNREFVEYQYVFGGVTKAKWSFLITIVVGRIDEESAQDAIDAYIDPAGPVVAAIHANAADLLGSVADYTVVVTGRHYGSLRVGNTNYFGAQLSIDVVA